MAPELEGRTLHPSGGEASERQKPEVLDPSEVGPVAWRTWEGTHRDFSKGTGAASPEVFLEYRHSVVEPGDPPEISKALGHRDGLLAGENAVRVGRLSVAEL